MAFDPDKFGFDIRPSNTGDAKPYSGGEALLLVPNGEVDF